MNPCFRSVVVDDVSLAYTVAGRGDPLLLIMGFGGTMDFWGFPFIAPLMSRFRLIAFDNRGLGHSSIGEESPSIGRFAADAAGLLDHLGVRSANVMGWSMGGYVAQELALARPDLVGRLILYGTCCDHRKAMARNPETFRDMMDMSGTDVDRTRTALKVLFPRPWLDFHPDFERAFLSHPMSVYSRCAQGIAGQVEAISSWEGCCDRIGELALPVMVVAGEMDEVIPCDLSEEMARKIRQGRYRSFPDGGHGLIYQHPADLAGVVADFIENRPSS